MLIAKGKIITLVATTYPSGWAEQKEPGRVVVLPKSVNIGGNTCSVLLGMELIQNMDTLLTLEVDN